MIPKSLSASALLTADACLAMYWAQNIEKAPDDESKIYADLGTACHAALEYYVQNAVIDRTFPLEFSILEGYFGIAYQDLFNTTDFTSDLYIDGIQMLRKWWTRTKWDKIEEIVSCEVKETFPIKTSIGDIPFNYIWDRCDKLVDEDGRLVIRVVDYKSIRVPVTSEQLHTKIQARCYSLAARIKYPQADEIWVQFDLLRHDPIGTRFTREEDIATWKWLKNQAERIIEADETNLPALEQLNPNCRYCIRKLSCEALEANLLVGGISSLTGADEAANILGNLTVQIAANVKLAEQLEQYLLRYAEENDMLEWETPQVDVKLTMRRSRKVDSTAVARVLGPNLVAQYGRITVTDIDKLMKDPALPEEKKTELQALIYKTTGEPSVKVTPKSSLEEE